MKHYKQILTAVITIISVILSGTTVWAAGMVGTGSNRAMAPPSGAVDLIGLESHWYAFKYEFDSEEDEQPAEARVQLKILSGNLDFEVYTTDRFGPYEDDDDDPGPVGIGTSQYRGRNDDGNNVYNDSRLVWSGSARTTGIFYVIVQGRGSYTLDISGMTVSFPQWTRDNRDAFESQSQAPLPIENFGNIAQDEVSIVDSHIEPSGSTIPQETQMGEAPGYGPHSAITPTEGEVTLAPGEWRWYEFKYNYDNSDNENMPEHALATLKMEEADSIAFEVWTLEEVQLWSNNEEFEPVGKGTPMLTIDRKSDDDNDELVEDEQMLAWVGSAKASQKFYIIVKNQSHRAASYTLSVTGPAVSFY